MSHKDIAQEMVSWLKLWRNIKVSPQVLPNALKEENLISAAVLAISTLTQIK